jgi:hypothetical protein
MAHLARRAERTRMVAAVPNGTTTSERAVHGACEPNGESADPRGPRARVAGLGEQMEMILLDGEFDDPKLGA